MDERIEGGEGKLSVCRVATITCRVSCVIKLLSQLTRRESLTDRWHVTVSCLWHGQLLRTLLVVIASPHLSGQSGVLTTHVFACSCQTTSLASGYPVFDHFTGLSQFQSLALSCARNDFRCKQIL